MVGVIPIVQYFRQINISLVLFDDDAPAHQVLVQFDADIASALETDFRIPLPQRLDEKSISYDGAASECNFQRFCVLGIRDGLSCGFTFLRESVILYQFRQSLSVDAERERLELPFPDVHRLDLADVAVKLALGHLQDGFCLVIQFGTDMPPRVVITFVQVQHGVDVQVMHTRPAHQVVYQVHGLAGAVDVVHQVADAVYHDKAYLRVGSKRMVDDLPPLLGTVPGLSASRPV